MNRLETRHNLDRVRTPMMLKKLAAALSLAAVIALGIGSAAEADHGQPFGTNFGLADAYDADGNHVSVFHGVAETAPIDPDPKALWSGTCDTELGSTAGNGIGTADSPALHCIDPGRGYFAFADQEFPDPPLETTWQPGEEPAWRLDTVSQAGAHPDLTLSFWLQRSSHSPLLETGGTGVQVISDGEPKDVVVKLPPGFVGNPNALPQCSAEAARTTPPACPPETQIGVSEISLARASSGTAGGGSTEGGHQRVPVWNVEPRKGKLAEFLLSANINEIGRVNVPIVARARTDSDFGIDALALNLPSGLPVVAQTITLWGVPFADSHAKYRPPTQYIAPDGRTGIPAGGFSDTPDANGNTAQYYEPSWGPVLPFFSNPTECNSAVPPVTRVEMASWRAPGDLRAFATTWDEAIAGCEDVPFDPQMDLQATNAQAGGASGLTADLTIPQRGESPFSKPGDSAPAQEVRDYVEDATEFWRSGAGGSQPNEHLASAQMEEAVVALPEGVSLNPSSATGLQGCSDAAVGLTQAGPPAVFNNEDPFDGQGAECPTGSRIGTAEVYSPIVPLVGDEEPGVPNLVGDVVLGEPQSTDPQSGKMLRLFLVLRNRDRGLVAKIAGSTTADPATGRLTTTFDQNPRVPFETLRLQLKGGSRGTLALPQQCGPRDWSALLTPWTAAHDGSGTAEGETGAFGPTTDCANAFTPTLEAAMSDRRGGGTGSFAFTLSRDDTDQWMKSLTAELPLGLLAAVGDVPLCTNAQAAAAACPEASRIGTVDAAAGAGSPFVLEKKGAAYLTEGYKGAPYGMATIVPVEAGPFTGQWALSTMVVRQAVRVDPTDASVTVESDPFPHIWHGIPMRIRRVTVRMDRPNFMRNPTDCSPKRVSATIQSLEGAAATANVPFQASGCGSLPFAPKLALRLIGKKQVTTGKHPSLRAVMTQEAGDAAAKRVKVVLPKKLALDPTNASKLPCEFLDGIKPEPTCPARSIVGSATAISPLLSRPLRGNVYFVKNVRIDPVTGAPRRTLPMLIVALRGEIAVNIRGESDVIGGKLVNTFANIPDAPLSRFQMDLKGGRNGILLVTDSARGPLNICGRLTAGVEMDGQNGRRHDRTLRVTTPCKSLAKKVTCKTKKQRRTKACKRRAAGKRR